MNRISKHFLTSYFSILNKNTGFTPRHFKVTWHKFLLLIFFVLLAGCSQEELDDLAPGRIETVDGISADDLEEYQGDLGLSIDSRNVAKKGYKPTKARITVQSSNGNFSRTINLDPYLFFGKIKFPIDSLPGNQATELRNGVDITIEILAPDGKVITSESHTKKTFKPEINTLMINAESLVDLETRVNLKKDLPYYIQLIKDGKPANSVVVSQNRPLIGSLNAVSLFVTNQVAFTGPASEPKSAFNFQKISGEENVYAIIENNKGTYVQLGFDGTLSGGLLKKSNPVPALSNHFKFRIEKEAPGIFVLKTYNGMEIRDFIGIGLKAGANGGGIRVRFVPMTVQWEAESIETRYLDPILPPAQTGFGFNNTLVNCGNGELQQTIGVQIERSVTVTSGWEESLSISSTHESSVSTTLGVEVEAGFFGNKATYSAEISSSYTYTSTNTTESTEWGEQNETTTETFFSERLVTVPPKNASLVYDAFQYYDKVVVPYVQRLRVKARVPNSNLAPLTGAEIKSQFHFNGFEGVISAVGSDYIEITMKGTVFLTGIIKTKSEVLEADPGC